MPPANRCPQCGCRAEPGGVRPDGRLTCPACGIEYRATGSRALGSHTGLILLVVLGGGGLLIVVGLAVVIGLWFLA